MEECEVVIVGAGPAGLTLGLSLAKYHIHSIILEKEAEITDDPRGVFLAHDAVRILWDLGIGDRMSVIGHEVESVNFHESSFARMPYYTMDTSIDVANQALANGILQVQPYLEQALRDNVSASAFCTLRCACTVKTCEEAAEQLIVGYTKSSQVTQQIKCSWLIGADGKRGVVRKHFLEASAGIKQQDAAYRYDGTWVASNFRITLPTPESHPSFPLWSLGYTPEKVYDLFWPQGWHFASPPGKATASGRFGPHTARLWRHEFEQDDWEDSMDAEALLWEHITPMLSRTTDVDGRPLPKSPVSFPRECIDVLRCRPFRFTHKLVNRWFDNRKIIIGDAAHVFPPFGGQGIASGIRDAHQLSWRLALLCQPSCNKRELTDHVLSAWATERTTSIYNAAELTKVNGQMCNGTEPYLLRVYRWLDTLISSLPISLKLPSPLAMQERTGFKLVKDGCYASEFRGGGRIAQVWVQSNHQTIVLSDTLLRHDTIMTLFVLDTMENLEDSKNCAQNAIQACEIHPGVLNDVSVVLIARDLPKAEKSPVVTRSESPVYQICDTVDLEKDTLMKGYRSTAFLERIGEKTKYAIVRPDFYIYAVAVDEGELRNCIGTLKDHLRF